MPLMPKSSVQSLDPLATANYSDDEEDSDRDNNDTGFDIGNDSDDEETKIDSSKNSPVLARSEEIIVVSKLPNYFMVVGVRVCV